MAYYNSTAKKLRLRDVGELEFGEKLYQECGTQLRMGEEILSEDMAKKIYPKTFSYCPKRKRRIDVVFVPRLIAQSIKFEPHDD